MQNLKIIVISAIFISVCLAQNYVDVLRYSYPNNVANSKSLGMGNSVMTTAGGLSALSFNPAALGLEKDTQFGFGLNLNNLNAKTKFFNGSMSTDKNRNNFNQIGFIAPMPTLRGSMVLGFSYDRVADFSKSISFNGFNSSNTSMIRTLALANDDLAYKLGLSYKVKKNNVYIKDDTKIRGNLNQSGGILESGYFDKISFAFALEFKKGLFIGLTTNLYYAEYNHNRTYLEADTKNIYGDELLLDETDKRTKGFVAFRMNDEIVQDVSGYGFTVGFLYKMKNGFRFAGSVKSPDFIEIKEKYRVKGESTFQKQRFETNWLHSGNTYNIRTPFEIAFGTSYQRNGFLFSGNVTLVNYKQMKFTGGLSSNAKKIKNDAIDKNFRNVANLNIGTEYKPPNFPVALRFGFIFKKSPYKNDAAKYDKKYITAGIGYNLTYSLTLDAAYMYGWWEDIGDNYNANVSRTYQKISKSNLSLNLSMRL